ncbi:RDD family protein [Streptomyces sp. NPDC007205]|uniref:RDD family protein n=1 Tax=Streptomyces sp. NPDC007205 TaxID=3154316 RepID=UPI0033E019B7
MSAPTPAPGDDRPREGYYPDPSIPGYVRYWNGASWVPGTSRPAPKDGEPLTPPPGVRAAPAAVEETGPHFFDEDPAPAPSGQDGAGAWGAGGTGGTGPAGYGEQGPAGAGAGGYGVAQHGAGGQAGPRGGGQPGAGGPHGRQGGGGQAAGQPAGRFGSAGDGDGRAAWGADPRVPAEGSARPTGQAGRTDGTASSPPGEGDDQDSGGTFIFRRPVPGPAAVKDDGTMTFRPVPGQGRRGTQPASGAQAPGAEAGAGSGFGPYGAAQGPGFGAPASGSGAGGHDAGAAGSSPAPGGFGPHVPAQGAGFGAPGTEAGPGSGFGAQGSGSGAGSGGSAATGSGVGPGAGPAGPGGASAGTPGVSGGFGPQGPVGAPTPPSASSSPAQGPGFGAGKAAAARAAAQAPQAAQSAQPAQAAVAPSVPAQGGAPAAPLTSGPGGGQASWAQQVHQLAGGGDEQPVAPWKPPVDDPFQAAARRQAAARPAGLGKRFAARLIDTLVLGAVTAAAAVPLGIQAADHVQEKIDAARLSGREVTVWLLDGTTATSLGVVLAVLLLFGVVCEVLPTAKWGRTLGKKLLGIEVRDIEAHEPPGFGPALRRWLVYSVPGLLGIGIVGVLWCLFDRPWHQCWHDKAAHTFVAG